MADRMAKKFGINSSTTTTGENSEIMKSPHMHALASFLSITGQGMSTWMVQSMSSAQMQQQYVAEIMSCILKICQENAKMESTIVHTNRKITDMFLLPCH